MPGSLAYYAQPTGAGDLTITVCEDQASTTDSPYRAAEWVRQNVNAVAGSPPKVPEGNEALAAANATICRGLPSLPLPEQRDRANASDASTPARYQGVAHAQRHGSLHWRYIRSTTGVTVPSAVTVSFSRNTKYMLGAGPCGMSAVQCRTLKMDG